MNDLFVELVVEMFEECREMFEMDIQTSLNISAKYNKFRSFRGGSESRAVAKKVSEEDPYVVH
jgi:hypothetical protein